MCLSRGQASSRERFDTAVEKSKGTPVGNGLSAIQSGVYGTINNRILGPLGREPITPQPLSDEEIARRQNSQGSTTLGG